MKSKGEKDQEFNILLTVNRHLFSPLVVITFGSLILDMVSYPGFLQNHTGLPPVLFLFLSSVSFSILLFQRIFFGQKLTEEANLVLRINLISLPFLLYVYFMFSRLEKQNYLNYVFSTFHIDLPTLERITLFSIFLALLYVFSHTNLSNLSLLSMVKDEAGFGHNRKLNKKLAGPLIFFVSMLFLIASQFYAIFKVSIEDLADIARTPFASFEERKVQKFGGPYRTYQFIARHSEAKSVIAVPPQFVWGIVGNIGFSRYFLYPRFLIHPEDYTDSNMPNIDYYIIGETIPDVGKDTYKIWPTEKIPAESIYIFDELRQIEEKVDKPLYDPSDPVYINKWGIIKVPPGTKANSG